MGKEEHVEVVAVIGGGSMGRGIAQVFAQGGCQVRVQDTDRSVLEKAVDRIRLNLARLSEKGFENSKHIDEILSRIAPTTDLAEAVTDADFVSESIPEVLEPKQELFAAIEALAPSRAILASNTSMLRISDIGRDVRDKGRLVVAHWFNPPYLIPVVEVVKGPCTSTDTMEKTVSLLDKVGKIPIRVMKEVPGHLLNRIQFAIFRETLGLLQDGVATPEEIDKAVSGSLGLRLATIGPLRTIDFTGLDHFWFSMGSIYKCLDNSPEAQQILQTKVNAGHVGRMAGKGFFDYDPETLGRMEEEERDEKLMQLLKILYPERANAGF